MPNKKKKEKKISERRQPEAQMMKQRHSSRSGAKASRSLKQTTKSSKG